MRRAYLSACAKSFCRRNSTGLENMRIRTLWLQLWLISWKTRRFEWFGPKESHLPPSIFTRKIPQFLGLHGKVGILTVSDLIESLLSPFIFTKEIPQKLGLHGKVGILTDFALIYRDPFGLLQFHAKISPNFGITCF